jgi:hypothetical protein
MRWLLGIRFRVWLQPYRKCREGHEFTRADYQSGVPQVSPFLRDLGTTGPVEAEQAGSFVTHAFEQLSFLFLRKGRGGKRIDHTDILVVKIQKRAA